MMTTADSSVEMVPVETDEKNWDYHLPGKPGEGVMPCVRDVDGSWVTSFWKPMADIPPAENSAAIHVVVYGFKPVIEVGFGPTITEATLQARETEPCTGWQGHWGYWCGVGIDDQVRDYLENGGLFVLRVGMAPPPPVSVWIA